MDSESDEDSWSTIDSCMLSDDSELECSTCSLSSDEDCSFKREEAAGCQLGDSTNIPTAIQKPKFARENFVLKENTQNDLEEYFEKLRSEDPGDTEIVSSSSCTSGSEEEECPTESWTATDTRKKFLFTATPAIHTGSAKSPLDFFYLMFSPDFMQFLADTINSRGKEFAEKMQKVYVQTDLEEVYTLVCTHFMMGFFSSNAEDILRGRRPSLNADFNTYLRKDRYSLLFSLLTYRAAKLQSFEDYRSWYGVAKPIADKFNTVMKKLMVPGKYLNVEKETVLSFDDRNEYSRRPDRIRMHLLSDDNGIFQRVFLVDPELQINVRGDTIARALMEDFLDTGRSLITPNVYYVSVQMAEDFLKRKTYLTGILKKNRPRNPRFLKLKPSSTKLPIRVFRKVCMVTTNETAGEGKNIKPITRDVALVQGFNKEGVCVCKLSLKSVKYNLLSTEFDMKPAVDKRWECEILQEIFNHTNVLKRDRQLSKCGAHLEGTHNRHVAYILQAMCVNAYLMYKVSTGKRIKFVKFLEEILYQMLPLEANNKDKENSGGQKKRPGNGNRRREVDVDECIVN